MYIKRFIECPKCKKDTLFEVKIILEEHEPDEFYQHCNECGHSIEFSKEVIEKEKLKEKNRLWQIESRKRKKEKGIPLNSKKVLEKAEKKFSEKNKSLTIRGLDEETEKIFKQRAKDENLTHVQLFKKLLKK